MKITFINHASFIIEYKNIKLITDPWLEGSVFNEGWDLIIPNPSNIYNIFENITHIWFSHEHPDHFFPPNIKRIPMNLREKITILFQETNDKKVLSYCKNLGFKTHELENHKNIKLSDYVEFATHKVPYYDSWFSMKLDNFKIINFNDCVFDFEKDYVNLSKMIGSCDLMFTQFSYAGWCGNQSDKKSREIQADEKIRTMKKQIKYFRPKITIPIASFIFFSHKENFYNNDSINTPKMVNEKLKGTNTDLFFMRPFQEVNINDFKNLEEVKKLNQLNIEYYEKEYKNLNKLKLNDSDSIQLSKVFELSENYRNRILKRNNNIIIFFFCLIPFAFFNRIKIWLSDYQVMLSFDFINGLKEIKGNKDYDIQLHSSSLAFIFQHDFGIDTLIVNGRFEAKKKNYKKFLNTFFIGELNNTGRYLNTSFLLGEAFEILTRYIKRSLTK